MPLLIHTVVGLSTGKSVGKCPFSVLHAQGEDALTASERSRAYNREAKRRVMPYLSSEPAELTFSKLFWGGQLLRATSCPWQKVSDDAMLLLQGMNELPTKNSFLTSSFGGALSIPSLKYNAVVVPQQQSLWLPS